MLPLQEGMGFDVSSDLYMSLTLTESLLSMKHMLSAKSTYALQQEKRHHVSATAHWAANVAIVLMSQKNNVTLF